MEILVAVVEPPRRNKTDRPLGEFRASAGATCSERLWGSATLSGLSLLTALMLACGGAEREPLAPADVPPLPPTAGTSVGILLAQEQTLGLSAQQTAKLQVIELELEAVNAPIEAQFAELSRSKKDKKKGKAKRGGSGMRGGVGMRGGGGRGGGGRGGGMRGGGGKGGGGGPKASASPPQQSSPKSDTATLAVRQKLRRNNSIALARALQLLDPTQTSRAQEILDEHGHEMPQPELQHADYETEAGGRGHRGRDQQALIGCLSRHLELSASQRQQLDQLIESQAEPSAKQRSFENSLSPGQRAKLDEAARACGLTSKRG